MGVIDINNIREWLLGLRDKPLREGMDLEGQIEYIHNQAASSYGIDVPEGVIRISHEKFGGYMYESPLILTNITNSLIRQMIANGMQDIELRNPNGLYFLAAGLIGKVNLTVYGDVGNSFAGSCKIDGTVRIYGNAENGLCNQGYQGRVVVHKMATELAGQTNQGVDILVLGKATERTGAQMRGGSIVTFGLGHSSGLYMNGGILINLGLNYPGEELGTGMTGGVIYAPENAREGMNAVKKPLEDLDYKLISATLAKHSDDLRIEGLEGISISNPILTITNGSTLNYDFRDFVKIEQK